MKYLYIAIYIYIRRDVIGKTQIFETSGRGVSSTRPTLLYYSGRTGGPSVVLQFFFDISRSLPARYTWLFQVRDRNVSKTDTTVKCHARHE